MFSGISFPRFGYLIVESLVRSVLVIEEEVSTSPWIRRGTVS